MILSVASPLLPAITPVVVARCITTFPPDQHRRRDAWEEFARTFGAALQSAVEQQLTVVQSSRPQFEM